MSIENSIEDIFIGECVYGFSKEYIYVCVCVNVFIYNIILDIYIYTSSLQMHNFIG